MRHTILPLSVLFSVLVLFPSCKKSPQPKDVVLEFMQAIQESNFERAKEFATKDSHGYISIYSMFDSKRNENEREKIKHAQMEVIEATENGDQASVVLFNATTNQKETFSLVKEQGIWKVMLSLESILPVAGGAPSVEGLPGSEIDSILN